MKELREISGTVGRGAMPVLQQSGPCGGDGPGSGVGTGGMEHAGRDSPHPNTPKKYTNTFASERLFHF